MANLAKGLTVAKAKAVVKCMQEYDKLTNNGVIGFARLYDPSVPVDRDAYEDI